MAVARTAVTSTDHLPFDVEFQKSLLRLVSEDESFGAAAINYIEPQYFQSEILGWMVGFMKRFHGDHGVVPSLNAVLQETRTLDPMIRNLYEAMVDQCRQASLRDELWLRGATEEFAKRNIFVRAFAEARDLYNKGEVIPAIDHMMESFDDLQRVKWDATEEVDLFGRFGARQQERQAHDISDDTIPTGLPSLDKVLRGGLSLGELGIWMAYAKTGKSTLLLNLGLAAAKRGFPVFHAILEGSQKQVEDRYDAAFMGQAYENVRAGNASPREFAVSLKEAQYLKGMIQIRSYVERWDVTVKDLDESLRRMRREKGFRPKLIVLDYADLMTGREKKHYRTETESQRAAYRDVKRLTNRGYAIWTGAQARRPKADALAKEHLLFSSEVADTYEKIRAADFYGSQNQTPDERNVYGPGVGVMRMHAENYRDNTAGVTFPVTANFNTMQIYEGKLNLAKQEPANSLAPAGQVLGQFNQSKAF